MSNYQDVANGTLTQAQISAERNIRWVYWWLFGAVLIGSSLCHGFAALYCLPWC
jgi:hypothetical protein